MEPEPLILCLVHIHQQRKEKGEEGHAAGILNTLALGRHILILVLSLQPKTHLLSDRLEERMGSLQCLRFVLWLYLFIYLFCIALQVEKPGNKLHLKPLLIQSGNSHITGGGSRGKERHLNTYKRRSGLRLVCGRLQSGPSVSVKYCWSGHTSSGGVLVMIQSSRGFKMSSVSPTSASTGVL